MVHQQRPEAQYISLLTTRSKRSLFVLLVIQGEEVKRLFSYKHLWVKKSIQIWTGLTNAEVLSSRRTEQRVFQEATCILQRVRPPLKKISSLRRGSGLNKLLWEAGCW